MRVKLTLPAPVDIVWPAFRDPAQIRRWHGWDYAGLDEEIRCIFEDETIASESDRTLRIAGHLFALAEDGDRTVVRVTRSEPPTDEIDWARYYEDIEEGWLTFLQQLRFALARHPGEDRRTVHLAGVARAGDPPPATTALGLAEVRELRAGRRYEATTPWGQPLAGKVWFRSPLQLGLTVDSWGDGLLVVTESPSAPRPHGAATAVLSTYALGDGALEALQHGWAGWWATNYRTAEPGDAG